MPAPPTPPLSGRWIILLAAAAVGMGGLVYLVRRLGRTPRRPRKPTIPPLLPPLRLVRVWLSEGASGKGRVLADRDHLIAGAVYSLHVQIQQRGAQGGTTPGQKSRRGRGSRLLVQLFHPEGDLELPQKTAVLALPSQGASSQVHYPFRPLRPGVRQIRVCIYFGNVLLQSASVEALVVQRGGHQPARGTLRAPVARTVDYVASTDLLNLEHLPQPAVSLVTNRTSDGTHWIGVFAAGEVAGFRLRSGDLHTLDPRMLETVAGMAREHLAQVQGEKGYRLGDLAALSLEERLAGLEKDLINLARSGWHLYDRLFVSRLGAEEQERRRQRMELALRRSSIISVARCREDSVTIPWATLYDLPLDTGGELVLCEAFKAQLAANRWSSGMANLLEKKDLLDEPERCQANPGCPLRGPAAYVTVCPYGWWGFLHQVEQPLQQVTPVSVDQVPEAIQDPSFNQTSYLEYAPSDLVRLAMAAYPNIPRVKEYEAAFEALEQGHRVHVVCEEDRERVIVLLSRGGRHLYYFYCHGEVKDHVFRLKLGPAEQPKYIAASDLFKPRITWNTPRPLVILNACETVALMPERLDGLMYKLRYLGACGVVGTEIKVWTELAQPFGYQLVWLLLKGHSVGEAFLMLRRHMLRQFNPLGLVYSYYSPATVHLHDQSACRWCQAHVPARLPDQHG